MTTCGVQGSCGRPADHRGHHGGWRTDVRVALDTDVPALTATEVHVLVTVVEEGSIKGAAWRLRRGERTVKGHLHRIRDKVGAASTMEALLRLGWLRVPRGAAS